MKRPASGRPGRGSVPVVGAFFLTGIWVLACGGLGGATLPWLTGSLGGGSGLSHRGFLVPLAALVGLAALFGLEGRRSDSHRIPAGG